MGTSTMIDIMGAIIIGGFLLLNILSFQGRTTEQMYYFNDDVIVQRHLADVSGIIEHDFRKIGYCADPMRLPDPSQAILAADSTSITFLSDYDANGTPDTVRYALGPINALTSTPNPRDRVLVRSISGTGGQRVEHACTAFRLIYYNALNALIPFPITTPREIYMIQIAVAVESPSAYHEDYPVAYWQQFRLASRNLRNR
jgi:hypothetical protein